MSQKFNLKELLGYKPTPEQKELFYNLAVDKMVKRTAAGKDINNVDFSTYAPYSPSYAKKKGVSVNSVDLILTGKMLKSFEHNDKQPNMVEIAIEGGDVAKRAYNHDKGDTLPQREFFGFREEKDLIDVIEAVDAIKDQPDATGSIASSALDLVALRAAIQEEISVEFGGFLDEQEGELNRGLREQLRNG